MFDAAKEESRLVREIFEESCSSIQSWDNDFEMTRETPLLCAAIDEFQQNFAAREIIEEGCIGKLRPELRFDQNLCFAVRNGEGKG